MTKTSGHVDEPSLSFLANSDIMHILDDSIASEEVKQRLFIIYGDDHRN